MSVPLLPGIVIPSQAGIHTSSTVVLVVLMDSRLRGNDGGML